MSRRRADLGASDASLADLEDAALDGSVVDQFDRTDVNLLDRWNRHQTWFDARRSTGVDPYCRVTLGRIAPDAVAEARGGRVYEGVNFASQDYLALASHPAIVRAAAAAAQRYGVHSAGSAALMGNSVLSVQLEERLAEFLGYADCTVFPTGWGAGYGVIKTIVKPEDFVVIDVLAHACLQEGARNATRNVFSVPHLSNGAVASRLSRIRRDHPRAAVLVVTETVFSMDSDVPDLGELIALCRRFNATLMVDAAHDLGALGPNGGGILEQQGLKGCVDILMGSFSKTFASNGGFVACNHPALKLALRSSCGPLTFTNALSPIQAAIVLKALEIVASAEGAERRARLLDNVLRLRSGLGDEGFDVLGQPSAIVPTLIGDTALSRLATRYALEGGAIVNLVEAPAVSRNTCRWRLQVMSAHSSEHVEQMVTLAAKARRNAVAHLARRGAGSRPVDIQPQRPEQSNDDL